MSVKRKAHVPSKAHLPSMTDAAVKAKTGRDWAAWFELLDQEGAAGLEHKAITALLIGKYAVPRWWNQMITVEYERARGLRARHETATGFSVSVSKTIATSLSELYTAVADPRTRKKWFPKGAFVSSSQTKDKYFRGAWNETARLEMGFYAKGPAKSQLSLQIGKLTAPADVEAQREVWATAAAKLKTMLEKPAAAKGHASAVKAQATAGKGRATTAKGRPTSAK